MYIVSDYYKNNLVTLPNEKGGKMETVIGIDLGGTKILIGELTMSGEVLSYQYYTSVVTSQQEAIYRIKECLYDYLANGNLRGHVQGIGIGLVGRVDRKNGIWIEIHPELSHAIGLSQVMEEEFQLPCYLGNDVYCATLSEKVYGIGNKTKDFIYLNIGTGIAARCVINGQILEGKNFDAGEVGHMIVDINSHVKCVCGNKGCVETLASGLGLHNRVMEMLDQYPNSCISRPTQGRVSAQELFQGYDMGDELCQIIINRALQAVATTIMNLIRVSDPEAIVLGGGVGSSNWFIDHLMPLMNPKTIRFITKRIQKTSQDAKTIGLKGAALLVIEQLRKEGEKNA